MNSTGLREATARTATWRAMGSSAEVMVVADAAIVDDLLFLASMRVELIEERWSRFRPGSELNRLNERAGTGPVIVSEDLMVLVSAMVEGWESTAGLFDPTVLPAVRAQGYDADFATVLARDFMQAVGATQPAPGMSDIIIDPSAGTIELPAGIALDPGAIGKGLAADLVLDDLMNAGALGALVSLGGDLAFAGQSPDGLGWSIGIDDERLAATDVDRQCATWLFADGTHGAVATSTTRKRRWAHGTRHHSIDPRTGALSTSDVQQATVVADRAWIAETHATAALVLDSTDARDWLTENGLTGLVLTDTTDLNLTDPTASSRGTHA